MHQPRFGACDGAPLRTALGEVQRDGAATWAGTLLAFRRDPHTVTGHLDGGGAEAGEPRNRVAPEVSTAVARNS